MDKKRSGKGISKGTGSIPDRAVCLVAHGLSLQRAYSYAYAQGSPGKRVVENEAQRLSAQMR